VIVDSLSSFPLSSSHPTHTHGVVCILPTPIRLKGLAPPFLLPLYFIPGPCAHTVGWLYEVTDVLYFDGVAVLHG